MNYMNKLIILAMVLVIVPPTYSVPDAGSVVSKILKDKQKIISDLRSMIVDLGLNCATPDKWPEAYKELVKLLAGVAKVISEQGLTLALKEDYPTACHVLTKPQIASYTEGVEENSWSECHRWSEGICITKKHITTWRPQPEYYWPKYFLEVAEKGNDAHKSFARGNRLYYANRKIASALSKFVDLDGPISLVQKVFLTKNLLGTVGINVGSVDNSDLVKTAILTPFEKNRIRANHQKTQPSFEVNIWPVGLSQTLAQHLTVCGPVLTDQGKDPGGYTWAAKGIPMTCPVAMSKDSYAYWDTGMIDYLDPQAVASMAIASNPLSCGAAAGADAFGKLGPAKAESKGESGKISSSLADLTKKLRTGLKTCSWPILGTAQAIAGKVMSATDSAKWKGPYCTLWGSLAPRSSTSLYENDYSYANAALKFKIFSHELFGVPRGSEERWSLAYPWEGPGSSGISGALKEQFPFLENLGPVSGGIGDWDLGENEYLKNLMEKLGLPDTSGGSRSEGLLIPGDPKMVNASTSGKLLASKAANVAKELAYLAALTATSQQAARAAREAYLRQTGENLPSHDEMNREMNEILRGAEDDTALLGKQPIYGEVSYCHRSEQQNGLLFGDPGTNFDTETSYTHKDLPYRGPLLPFSRYESRESCLSEGGFSGCIDWRGGIRGNYCAEYNDGLAVFYKKMEIVGWKETQNPIVARSYKSECRFLGKYRERGNKEVVKWECKDREISQTVSDTREYIGRPNPRRPETLVENERAANEVAAAAQASTWVAAELARAKYSDLTGHNPLPGDKRIFTVWEKVKCTFPSTARRVRTPTGSVTKYDNCTDAFRHVAYKYFQTKLLRYMCDLFGQQVGKPWK